MKRVVLSLFAFAVTLTLTAVAADDKVPSTKEIMGKANTPKGLVKTIATAAKGEKWDAVAKDAEQLKAYGEALGKNKPKKGEAESWEKLAGAYKASTAAIAAGVEKKDAKAVADAAAAIGKSCGACHSAHK